MVAVEFLQAEFLAEEERVTIVPSTMMPLMRCIGGEFGPFLPAIEVEVPLYVALALRKVGRCKVRPPVWMTIPRLREKMEEERRKENAAILTEVPFYFAEVAHMLLQAAADDVIDPAETMFLIEDLINVRENKLRRFIQQNVTTKVNAVKLTNLASVELNKIRPHFTEALEQLYKLGSINDDEVEHHINHSLEQARSVPSEPQPRSLRRFQR